MQRHLYGTLVVPIYRQCIDAFCCSSSQFRPSRIRFFSSHTFIRLWFSFVDLYLFCVLRSQSIRYYLATKNMAAERATSTGSLARMRWSCRTNNLFACATLRSVLMVLHQEPLTAIAGHNLFISVFHTGNAFSYWTNWVNISISQNPCISYPISSIGVSSLHDCLTNVSLVCNQNQPSRLVVTLVPSMLLYTISHREMSNIWLG
jgi:hypothetical protein